MRFLLSFACLCLALAVAGCGTAPERRLDAPALRVTSLTATAGGHSLELRLINGNTAPLVVSRSTHTLYLGEDRIGGIDDSAPVGVPPLGGVNHTVAITGKLSAKIGAYLEKHPGEVPVHVASSLEITLSDGDSITLKTAGGGAIKQP